MKLARKSAPLRSFTLTKPVSSKTRCRPSISLATRTCARGTGGRAVKAQEEEGGAGDDGRGSPADSGSPASRRRRPNARQEVRGARPEAVVEDRQEAQPGGPAGDGRLRGAPQSGANSSDGRQRQRRLRRRRGVTLPPNRASASGAAAGAAPRSRGTRRRCTSAGGRR